MTDVPAQRTERSIPTSNVRPYVDAATPWCLANSPASGLLCTLAKGHDGAHSAGGSRIDGGDLCPVFEEWTDPAPADLPSVEAIAVERLVLDEQQPETIRDAAARYDDALTAVAIAEDAEQMAAEHWSDRMAETTVARREAAEARLALLALIPIGGE